MSHDVFYRFHQHNDFLYLTGFQEADAVLILETNDSIKLPDHKAILYTTPRNPYKEKWEGPLMGPDDAVDFLGVDEAYSLNLFAEHLEERFSKYDYSVWYYGGEQLPRIVDYSIDVIINDHLLHGINSCIKSIHSPLPLLQHLRAIKSEGEIKLMLKAGEIAAKSFKKAMSVTRPGMYEYQLESHFEHSCRMEGAQRMSFVPVVAGGHRGCHLHYTTNEQKLNDGQLVLMDAGAEYFGYVSDVTRTWPVNGSFTAAQKDLYEAILRVKNACIESCQSGITLNYLQALSKELLVMELKALGILPMSLVGSGLYSVLNGLYPHDLGHYLGLDVHDTPTLSHNVPLQPGMVITVEPGIYIRRDFPIKDPVRAKE
jgi:Xaa-Pro aminopeptidase